MKKLSPILAVGICVFFCQAAQAATWYVDASVTSSGDGASWQSAFKTIRKGINAASRGDSVLVAEGTYVENIYFHGKNISLTSTDPLDPDVVDATIIDGSHAGSVVTFDGTEDETCVLQGFRLQNGRSNVGGGICGHRIMGKTHATIQNNTITLNSGIYGGGVAWCDGLIQNNIISGNHAERRGGGVHNCHGTIKNNTIAENSVNENGGGLSSCDGEIQNNAIEQNSSFYGGGLYWCNGTVENNTITRNSAAREGGGLAFCDGTIRNNTINGNSAGNNEGGGLAYCDGMILDNLIQGNWASYHGGGLSYCFATIQNNVISGNSAVIGGGLSFCDLAILNNTITGNAATFDGAGVYGCNGTIDSNIFSENIAERDGGALAVCFATIQNNVVIRNSAGRCGGGLASCRGPIQSNTVTGNSAGDYGGGLYKCQGAIGNSIIWGNTALDGPQLAESSAPVFSCIEDWDGGGEGNIAQDPMFAEGVGGDYVLQDSSPCIDAGSNYYWFVWPQRDIRGNCRLAGERVDIGCYEHEATVDTDGDLLPDEEESAAGTDAESDDTDGDGLRDGLEVLDWTDPVAVTSPRTVHVPSRIPRIQMALLLAVNGEEIIVAPGTYRENLHFPGADVILRSSDPENPEVVQATVLDGGGAGPVLSFSGRESEACVLSGFTITGGYAYSGGGIIGGTPDRSTRATIQNNTITGNAAAAHGGGLYLCSGAIRDNTITGNSATRRGGGLFGCNGAIHNNTITSNSAGGFGGGLYDCDGIIENNRIAANVAEGTYVWLGQVYGNGGGLSLCDAIIRNNIITGNRALRGGGLHACNGEIENNTITGNSASDAGGGICECNGEIANCVIRGNTATTKTGEQVYESSAPSYSCIQDWLEGGEGNVAEDPRFADADGADDDPATCDDNNYRLSPDSPCVDAGRNEFWMGSAVDLDGNPRICAMVYPPTVDMGAYEYVFSEPRIAALYVNGSVTSSGDGTSWETALRTVQEGIDAASDGEIIIVAVGRYTQNIRFNGKNIVLRSTNPLDPAVVSGTIIYGSPAAGRASVVTFAGTEDETCVLSGFTICYGNAAYGGGICGGSSDHQTHATIENNIVTSNSADYGGGLAYCGGTIQGNTIIANSATHPYGEGGGLAFCEGTVRNNAISGNSSVWRGGGLGRCNGTIQSNAISGNSASSGAGLAYCDGCIESNTISENSAKVWGGGMYQCGGDIQSNTIVGNSASWGGGGLASCDGAIRNNTIVGNSASNTGGGLAWCNGPIRNCIIWENVAPAYPQVYQSPQTAHSCIQDWTGEGEGNIADDPRFVDPDGPDKMSPTYDDNDYHLSPDSPCVDAGRNEDWMWQTVDLDGNPRIWRAKNSWTADMGAYEFDSFPFEVEEILEDYDGVELTWKSRPGDSYTVHSCVDLLTGLWNVEATVPSHGESTTWSDPDTSSNRKFYRIGIQ